MAPDSVLLWVKFNIFYQFRPVSLIYTLHSLSTALKHTKIHRRGVYKEKREDFYQLISQVTSGPIYEDEGLSAEYSMWTCKDTRLFNCHVCTSTNLQKPSWIRMFNSDLMFVSYPPPSPVLLFL